MDQADPAGAPAGHPRVERAATAIRRLAELAGTVLRGVRLLAVGAAAVVSLAWLAWLLDDTPASAAGWGRALVVLAVLLVPSGVLWLFLRTLRELQELPRRVGRLPADLRERSGDLWREARTGSGSGRRLPGLVRSTARFAWLVLSSRDLLSPYAAVSAALRPAILLAAVVAAALAAIEVVIGILALPILLA